MFAIHMLTANMKIILNTLLTPALVSAIAIIIMFILRSIFHKPVAQMDEKDGNESA